MTSTNRERGSISVWMALASLVMMMLVGLAVDLGGQVHAQQRAHSLAAGAARAGGEQIQAAPAVEGRYAHIDDRAARQAAEEYLTAAGVEGSVRIVDGDTITVTVVDTYEPRFLTFVGHHLTVTGTASARLVRTTQGAER